jgi:cell division protein ZapB
MPDAARPDAPTRLPSRPGTGSIGFVVSEMDKKPVMETELQRLETRVGELLTLVRQLNEENRALRNRQDSLSGERATLLQKNEQVRASVEAMIGRLRLLESGV